MNVEKIIREDFNVSRETFYKLQLYVDMVLAWQEKFNLIGRSTIDNIWSRHIMDSLQLLRYIPKNISHIFDLGTGAGLPGIVLSIILGDNCEIFLVESTTKKTTFLRNVVKEVNIKAKVVNDRIENIDICNLIYKSGNNYRQPNYNTDHNDSNVKCTGNQSTGAIDSSVNIVITARALASMSKLINYGEKFFDLGSIGIFLKGRKIEDEIIDAKKTWNFSYEKFQSITDTNGYVIVVKEVLKC